jgi:hypothetical protein
MEESDKAKTAFIAGSGVLFLMYCMPFGLADAPATFKSLIERALSGLPWDVFLVY